MTHMEEMDVMSIKGKIHLEIMQENMFYQMVLWELIQQLINVQIH